MTGLRWEVPPTENTRRDPDAIVAELKRNPGRWALVGEDEALGTAVWKLRGCEQRTVTGPIRGRGRMYVRWPEEQEKS